VTDEDVRSFEHSMAVGCGPILEAMTATYEEVFDSRIGWTSATAPSAALGFADICGPSGLFDIVAATQV